MKTRSSSKLNQKNRKREKEVNKQLVIRFPPDIADRIHENISDARLTVEYIDERHANCNIFDEHFEAILVSLPTIVETFRTADGYHLFKSGEISDILLIFRPGETPPGISKDFQYDHGLTPPTKDIVVKRKTKQESKANSHHESFISDVEYWDLAELQINALTSKEKKLSKTQRKEISEEPDIDPIILEKVLRKNGYSQFKGYSGFEISEQEIEDFDLSQVNLNFSQDHRTSSIPVKEPTDDADLADDLDNFEEAISSNDEYFNSQTKDDKNPISENTQSFTNTSENSDNSIENIEDSKYYEKDQVEDKNDNFEEDEEEDAQTESLKKLNLERDMLTTELDNHKINLSSNPSDKIIKQKIINRIANIKSRIKVIDEKIELITNQ